jgi:hypothetical protein
VARYWVYLNDEVTGPYGIDQLIRIRGFSRQTLVCLEEASGKPKNWISPAEIPELAHIFKAAEERLADVPVPAPKTAAKTPVARPAKPFVPAVTLRAPKRNIPQMIGWILLVSALFGGGWAVWSHYARQANDTGEKSAARGLIENVHLPAPSPFATLPDYFQEKNIRPRWEFERTPDGLYHVSLSWYAPSLTVYAFEVNIQAQTVRGLNSAATKLLSEGFPAPPSAKAKSAPAAKKSPAELFIAAVDSRKEAIEGGDFQAVWDLFSKRKKADMARAGMSEDGFIRLQGLTHKVESSLKQEILKTKPESDTEMLVLIKQTQDKQPDIFIKQLWTFENGAWKLDDEQKHNAETPAAPPAPEVQNTNSEKPQSPPVVSPPDQANPPAGAATTAKPTPSPTSLPGMSN